MEDQVVAAFEAGVTRSVRALGLEGKRVLAAVSGGADSVAMLLALVRSGVNVAVASLDHGLRPESASECATVARMAQELGVPCAIRQLGLVDGPSLEARAREARYAALARLRRELGCEVVATAHTASDQAETVVMRLLRGASGRGAAGIAPRREDLVVRPMLFATRHEVEAYLRALGVAFAADPMNRDSRFFRSRVRLEVMPVLEAVSEGSAARALARFAAHSLEDEAYLEHLAEAALDRALVGTDALDSVAVGSLVAPVRRRVLAAFLEANGVPLSAALIEEVCDAIAHRRRATLPRDLLLSSDEAVVRVVPAPPRR